MPCRSPIQSQRTTGHLVHLTAWASAAAAANARRPGTSERLPGSGRLHALVGCVLGKKVPCDLDASLTPLSIQSELPQFQNVASPTDRSWIVDPFLEKHQSEKSIDADEPYVPGLTRVTNLGFQVTRVPTAHNSRSRPRLGVCENACSCWAEQFTVSAAVLYLRGRSSSRPGSIMGLASRKEHVCVSWSRSHPCSTSGAGMPDGMSRSNEPARPEVAYNLRAQPRTWWSRRWARWRQARTCFKTPRRPDETGAV